VAAMTQAMSPELHNGQVATAQFSPDSELRVTRGLGGFTISGYECFVE